jgi:hypothetical protein
LARVRRFGVIGPIRSLFLKQFQLAESFGALFANGDSDCVERRTQATGSITSPNTLYPLLFVFPFAPKTVGIALLVLTNFTYLEAWRVKSPKTLLMLILNPLLFLTGAVGTAVGLLSGRQRYSQDK